MTAYGNIVKKATTTKKGLLAIEKTYRKHPENEIIPFARNTSYVDIATIVLQDDKEPENGADFAHPIALFQSRHHSQIGAITLCRKAKEFLEICSEQTPLQILSISAGMDEDALLLTMLVRLYSSVPNIENIYDYMDEFRFSEKTGPTLIIPDDARLSYTEEEREKHREKTKEQAIALENATKDAPFLNSIEEYTKSTLSDIDESRELVYDLLTKDKQISTILPYNEFIKIFKSCMNYITSVERDFYYDVIREKTSMQDFMDVIEAYITRSYIDNGKMQIEDLPALLSKLKRALFELYIVQDLIDDPQITDIKITAPDSIRVRVKGKAYLSNITFIDKDDYIRFVTGVAVKNNVDLKVPSQTFTDEHDEGYILRFSITAPYITGSGYPIMHIRKVARKKPLADELMKAGMFDEKIRDYLLDCGKNSRGVVFAGSPGSGKTIMLNWFLECAYESSAEILVIQESDELFAYRKGVMFEHVVNNPQRGEKPCTLETLGQMALVAGANVFVIGEAKGAEICSAITLSNSGCRTAITIHSPSSVETVDKMADLAMRGYATSFEQAKRMIKSFQTIVYLSDFKVQEISEIIGYDDEKKDMIYRYIYKRPQNSEK